MGSGMSPSPFSTGAEGRLFLFLVFERENSRTAASTHDYKRVSRYGRRTYSKRRTSMVSNGTSSSEQYCCNNDACRRSRVPLAASSLSPEISFSLETTSRTFELSVSSSSSLSRIEETCFESCLKSSIVERTLATQNSPSAATPAILTLVVSVGENKKIGKRRR